MRLRLTNPSLNSAINGLAWQRLGRSELFRITTVLLMAVWLIEPALARPLTVQQEADPIGVELLLADGSKQSARLVQVDGNSISIAGRNAASDQPLTVIDFGDLSAIQFASERPKNSKTEVVAATAQLIDLSQIRLSQFSMKENLLSVAGVEKQEFKIKTRDLAAIILPNQLPANRQKELKRAIKAEGLSGDSLVVDRDDSIDVIEGIARGIDGTSIKFSVADQTASVPLERLLAITFFHATRREFEPARIKAQLIDGSTLELRRFELEPDQRIKLTTLAGVEFRLAAMSVDQITFGTRANTLLSDLEPTTNDWRPLLASPALVESLRRLKLARVNESFDRQPLDLETLSTNDKGSVRTNTSFNSGFSIAAGGKLAFRLGKNYSRCSGLVGFAPSADIEGSVRLRFSADGRSILDETLVKRKMDSPLQLDLPISRCDRLVIEVEYLDGRSVGDQLHLVNLVLTK